MKKTSFTLAHQKTLVYAGLDSLSPAHMLPQLEAGKSPEPKNRKNSVIDFVLINLKAKLIEGFPAEQDGFDFSNIHQIDWLLRNSDPDEQPEIWLVMQFAGTLRLQRILKQFKLDGWEAYSNELDNEFVDAMVSIYDSVESRGQSDWKNC